MYSSAAVGCILCKSHTVLMVTINVHRKSGRPFHNFISWQDLRAAEQVKSWNQSATMKVRLDLSVLIFFLNRDMVFTTYHSTQCNNWIDAGAQYLCFNIVDYAVVNNYLERVTLFLCLCWQSIHGVMKVLHFLTRQKRFLAASLVVFSTQHVSLRLAWMLANCPEVRETAGLNCCGRKGDVIDGER